ncbi:MULTISPECIES: hypothetical protein [Comamonas]|uniref:hypothetical protein n=1 Tax=Comamonas TaxID=283 RepID=UPI0012BDB446|nr:MULTISPECIES: hypothetical protein [Comamonas]MPT10078.1 hypothetical protein [Comamonas sp.]
MTKPAEIIHAGLEFLCRFAKRLVGRGAVRLVGSLAYQCRLPGHLAATHCALVCTVLHGKRLALAIAFVFGPDGHDVRGLHGESLLYVCSTSDRFSSLTAFWKIFTCSFIQ